MEAGELLQALETRGLEIRSEGGKLLVQPSSLLDDHLRELVRHHREELLCLVGTNRDLGWDRMRQLAASLGLQVECGGRRHQLWGLTPRGAILFDGKFLRTVALEGVARSVT